jgi:hypothetical protein
VLVTCSFPDLSTTSQTQAEPNCLVASLLKVVTKFSYEPKSLDIAAASVS